MLQCCLCQSLDASPSGYDESRLGLLLDHAGIHTSQINRNAKANILKIFANCFPNIAAKYTIREVVDSMEAPQNSGSNDGTDTKAVSVPPKRKEKMPQSQDTTLVKNMEKRSPIDKQGKPSSWQPPKISVHVQCRKILEASCDKSQQRFRCGVCADQVVLRIGQRDGFDTWCAIDHVLRHHMDIKPFRCPHCDYTAKGRFSMGYHVKLLHQAPDYSSIHFVNEVNAHQKEICEMVTTCFGNQQWKAIKSESKETKITKQYGDTTLVAYNGNHSAKYDGESKRPHGTSVIGAHSRQTLASYSKEQHRFECGICGTFVKLRYGPRPGVKPNLLLQHAVAHMRIRPFRCPHCTVAMKFRSDISRHVKNVHKLAGSSSSHFIDETSVHEKEICEMITKCFGKKG